MHTPKGCLNHAGYDAQGWWPDVHGRHTNAKNDVNACFARAADYDDWCGGDETAQAMFVSNTGEVTLDSAVGAKSFSGGQTVYLKSHHGTYFYMDNGDFKVASPKTVLPPKIGKRPTTMSSSLPSSVATPRKASELSLGLCLTDPPAYVQICTHASSGKRARRLIRPVLMQARTW